MKAALPNKHLTETKAQNTNRSDFRSPTRILHRSNRPRHPKHATFQFHLQRNLEKLSYLQSVPEAVDSVRNQHDVLVPTHELALAGGPPHDEALHPLL